MKKIITVIAMSIMCMVASAQYDASNKYSFWSNWSVGVNATYTNEIVPLDFNGGFGAELQAYKQLSQHWDMRIMASVPVGIRLPESDINRFGSGMVGVMWHPFNCGFYIGTDDGISLKVDEGFHAYFVSEFELGWRFILNEHNHINVEVGALCVHPNGEMEREFDHIARVGWAHCFGPTKMDRELIAQKELAALAMMDNYNALMDQHRDTCTMLKLQRVSNNDKDQLIIVLNDSIAKLNGTIDSLYKTIAEMSEMENAPTVVYNINSSTISKDQYQYIDMIAEAVKGSKVKVYGFADALTGTEEYNMKLSEKRAETLKSELAKRGCDESMISTEGCGGKVMFGDGNSAASRKAVVVVVE